MCRFIDQRLTGVLLVAVLGVMGFVEPSPVSTESPQMLAGTSELTVQGAGTAVVEVPEDVVVSLADDSNPNLALETDASAAAAVLVGSGGKALLWSRVDPAVLCTDSSPSSCQELLSQLHTLAAEFDRPVEGVHAVLVPAGTYTLHVVTTDSSAVTTATIVAAELSGTTTLQVTATPPHEFTVLPDMSPTGGAGLVSAGSSGELAGDGGILFRFVAATGSLTGSAEIGECLYEGVPAAPSVAYVPPCPAASNSTSVRFLGAGNEFTYTLQGMHIGLGPGTWSQGGYVAGPMLADDGVVINLWLG